MPWHTPAIFLPARGLTSRRCANEGDTGTEPANAPPTECPQLGHHWDPVAIGLPQLLQ
jgi:hypothetical protein